MCLLIFTFLHNQINLYFKIIRFRPHVNLKMYVFLRLPLPFALSCWFAELQVAKRAQPHQVLFQQYRTVRRTTKDYLTLK